MLARAAVYLRMIKFSHSVFALPFAFTSALLAAGGIPSWNKIFWITVAMVGGRSAAMGINRVIDRKVDALNPRTSGREIPAGTIKTAEAVVFIIVSTLIFLYAAYRLNPLCLKLSPLALAVFVLYPYTKRFTWLSHIVLGIAIAGAPVGAWIALRGTLDMEILPLALSVVFWLAGFDVLYALQDVDFDKKTGLRSIPQRFGIKRALFLARTFHILTWMLLLVTATIFDLGILFHAGLILVGVLLVHEHRLVKEDDLSRLNMAFFNMNGYISLTVLVFTLLDFII
ncbi:Menaquinone via futalosine polyprenyltransferase (MenA homolog) [hydrothermal vent metagenome]|uniref:Menaquinone via futalosine polyprenyltransferase (MenA homolog) n=1 Tax=hydrothermal vent metagenome TaxID=652676 RepID=A0A3B1CU34_9ZZZZ